MFLRCKLKGESEPTPINVSMLSFLILLYALIGVQGKAFPSRYKRNYEASYHYIPYEGGIIQIPAGYSPENLQNYQDYVHRYVQTNGHDWSSYYQQPMAPQPIQDPYSDINGYHKIKAKHNWHFIDQNHVPITHYTEGRHKFEPDVEAPNVVEALVKKEVTNGHGAEYDEPIVVEALIKKEVTNGDGAEYDEPIVVEALVKKEETNGDGAEYDEPIVVEALVKKEVTNGHGAEYNEPIVVEALTRKDHMDHEEAEIPVIVDSLTKNEKPGSVIKHHNVYEYNIKEKPIKEKPIKEKPIKEKPIKEKPIKEKPIKEKPIKEKPVLYDAFDYPVGFDFSNEHEAPTVIEALIRKAKPPFNMEEEHEMPIVVEALVQKHSPVYENERTNTNDLEFDQLINKRKSSTSYDAVKVGQVASYDNFELPVVVNSLTKKEKPVVSYHMHEPVKETLLSWDEFELPVVVDTLGKKDGPVKVNTISSYGAFELPIVETLAKKDKPIEPAASYVMFELPVVVDSLGKKDEHMEVEPVVSYNMHEPVKEKHVEVKPVAPYDTFEHPIVDSLTEKERPVKVKPSATDYMYESVKVEPSALGYIYEPIKEKPIGEKPVKKRPVKKPIKPTDYKPVKEKPVKEKPVKEKPVKEKPVKEKPVKEKPVKEKPVKEKPVKEKPVGFDASNKVTDEHEAPTVIEALIRKVNPPIHMGEKHETPIVVKELVRKHPILTKEDVKNFDIPVIEALTLEQDIENNETPKQEYVTFDETHSFEEPEIDGFDENADQGSAMDFDRSRFARSFLPGNSNIFSMVSNIQEQERRKFRSCVTPKNETGNCMPFQMCSVSSAVSNIDELLRNVCVDDVLVGVCCPEFPVETVRVDWEQLNPVGEMLNEEKSSEIPKECGRLPPMVSDEDPWPWMASLISKSSNKEFCGGALITEQYVLTAAHCTIRIPRNQILVRLGRPASENPEPDFEVIEIKRHAGYNPRTMQNDIALLKLSRRVKIGDFRRVVCLAKDEEGIEGLVSESASLLHWKETPGEMKDVESLSVISNKECQSRMRTAIADSIVCTEPRTDETMCNADSGAPLIVAKDDQFEVIGILTWNRNDCDERFPTVFTRVSNYRRWIEKLAS